MSLDNEKFVDRPDRLETATFTVGTSVSTVVTPSNKAGLLLRNGHGSYVIWVRDPNEGAPAAGVGFPIPAGGELPLGDYRGSLRAISPSGNAALYTAWTTSSRAS